MSNNNTYTELAINAIDALQKQVEDLMRQLEELKEENQKSREELAALRAELSEEKVAAKVNEAMQPIMDNMTAEITESVKKDLQNQIMNSFNGDKK